jgi:hypothetical protein
MRGEDLVVVMRGQKTFGAVECHGLLHAHHQRVGKAAQQHHDAEDHIHDPDALVVDGGEPLAPQIAPEPEISDGTQHCEAAGSDHDEGADEDRLVQGQRIQRQPAEDEFEKVGIVEH